MNKKMDLLKTKKTWLYSETVREHFFHPRNLMQPGEEKTFRHNAAGLVGSPACGDVLRIWLWIDPPTEKIKKSRWLMFGCGAAIGAASMLSVMLTEKGGLVLEKARKIKPQDIIKRLGGLPEIKYHCSVLGDKALRLAINDYFRRRREFRRIIPEEGKIIDPATKTTDKDIETAILEGADSLEKIQAKTKVGIANPAVLSKVNKILLMLRRKQ